MSDQEAPTSNGTDATDEVNSDQEDDSQSDTDSSSYSKHEKSLDEDQSLSTNLFELEEGFFNLHDSTSIRNFTAYPVTRYPNNQNPLLPLALQKKLGKWAVFVQENDEIQ